MTSVVPGLSSRVGTRNHSRTGIPPDLLKELPGYDPDVKKNRNQARAIMDKLGYGPTKRLRVKLSTRDLPQYRDPRYFPKIRRKNFIIALNLQTSGPDLDSILDLLYGCGSSLNWDGYCSTEVGSGATLCHHFRLARFFAGADSAPRLPPGFAGLGGSPPPASILRRSASMRFTTLAGRAAGFSFGAGSPACLERMSSIIAFS